MNSFLLKVQVLLLREVKVILVCLEKEAPLAPEEVQVVLAEFAGIPEKVLLVLKKVHEDIQVVLEAPPWYIGEDIWILEKVVFCGPSWGSLGWSLKRTVQGSMSRFQLSLRYWSHLLLGSSPFLRRFQESLIKMSLSCS